MQRKKFNDLEISKIISLYKDTNLSARDIAKEYYCSHNTIIKVLKLNNVYIDSSSKMSAKSKGNSYKKGKKLSNDSKQRISLALKGRKPSTLGKIYSEEERMNISNGVKKAFEKSMPDRILNAREIGVLKIKKSRNKCKNLLRRVLNITGNKKSFKTYEQLGYTEKDLIAHIEKQFKEGMSWEVRNSFHIDHIKPVSAFLKEGIFDPKIINALDNLQPLYPRENQIKSDKYKEYL